MPVLPEVGSTTITSFPGPRVPALSACSIMARAMRSFTDRIGLYDSSLTHTSADPSSASLFNRTRGVLPMVSRMLLYFMLPPCRTFLGFRLE